MKYISFLFFALIFMAAQSATAGNILIELFKQECALFNKEDTGIYCNIDAGPTLSLVFTKETSKENDEDRELKYKVLLIQKRYIEAGGVAADFVYKMNKPFKRSFCRYKNYASYCEPSQDLDAYCSKYNNSDWYCTKNKP